MKRRNLTINDPSILREYFGKWVLDSNSLVVRYNADKNHYDTLPQGIKFNYIMGIDIGFKDADAICVLAWSEQSPVTYLVEEKLITKQDITALAEEIEKLDKTYKVDKMVMDMGALGKKIGEEIIRRHKIPVEAADKTRKMENIAIMNDALRGGRLMAKKTSRFVQDSYLVEYDMDKSRPDRLVVSDSYHSDIIDAVLYAFKVSPAFSWEPAPAKAKPGTREWFIEQEQAMWDSTLEHAKANDFFTKWLKGEE